MGKYRTPSPNSKYSLPKEDYLTAIHYSLRYPLWKEYRKEGIKGNHGGMDYLVISAFWSAVESLRPIIGLGLFFISSKSRYFNMRDEPAPPRMQNRAFIDLS